MLKRDGYLPGVPCWVDTSQPDPAAAVAFYHGAFGWEFEDVAPPGSPAPYFIGRLDGGDVAAVGGVADGRPPIAVWNTYIWVERADEAVARALDAGGRTIVAPFEVGDAGTMAVLRDPDGAEFCVWQANAHKGAQVVNEPGSLNFNSLNIRDVAAAELFYGSVFGWESMMLGDGGGMWRLPGYGDFLEQRDPGLRQRMVDLHAPEGFEDVVATFSRIPADQPDAAARWGVTFAVDDADALAKRATELGGTVVVAPSDAPWVRTTVIADPQGATFTASKFVPERGGAVDHDESALRAA